MQDGVFSLQTSLTCLKKTTTTRHDAKFNIRNISSKLDSHVADENTFLVADGNSLHITHEKMYCYSSVTYGGESMIYCAAIICS